MKKNINPEKTNVVLASETGIVIESPDHEIFVVSKKAFDEFTKIKWPNQKIKIIATKVPILL